MKDDDFCQMFLYSLINLICFLLKVIFLTAMYNVRSQVKLLGIDKKIEYKDLEMYDNSYKATAALFAFNFLCFLGFMIVLFMIINKIKVKRTDYDQNNNIGIQVHQNNDDINTDERIANSGNTRNSNSDDKIAKDYAHINKIDRFSNGDYLVSFRHIGLIRFDYQTVNTKWVIGYGHNDFKMDENALPYTQHDSIILDDNTIVLFDNAVGDKSRVLKYHIDEKNMSVEADIYVSEYPNSEYMGSSQLLKDDTYLINYGGNMQIVCFEIYDFKNKKQLFLFNFDNKDDIYAVTQGDYIFNRLYNPE